MAATYPSMRPMSTLSNGVSGTSADCTPICARYDAQLQDTRTHLRAHESMWGGGEEAVTSHITCWWAWPSHLAYGSTAAATTAVKPSGPSGVSAYDSWKVTAGSCSA